MFYLAALLLAALAGLLVLWPLLKKGRRTQAVLATTFLLGMALGVYLIIGRPDLAINPPLNAQQSMETPNVEAMVERLSARLEEAPEDPEGWAMLGRSYFMLERYEASANAYAEAIKYSGSEDPELLAAYAEARVFAEPESLVGESGRMFERVLELDAENPRGLWYGGLAAVRRGEPQLAAARWQRLLDQKLPEEFRRLVLERLAEISPDAVPAWLRVQVTVADAPDLPENAALFVFVRDPAAPNGMPIAARKLIAPQFPVSLPLTDADLLQGNQPGEGRLEVGALLAPGGDLANVAWRGVTQWQPGSEDSVRIELERIRPENLPQ